MFHTHPLNVMGKLLRRFYEPLVLLGVLDPTRGAYRPDLITDRGLDETSKLWRNFLDKLSFVCDFEKGGDTVTAAAAQQTNEAPIYWLASNSTSREKARDHLIWVFARLSLIYGANPISTAQLQDEITTQCIELSSEKIKIYSTWLLQAIAKAKDTKIRSMSHEDEVLFEGLDHFESLKTDFHRLCAFAYRFRRSEPMQILGKRHNSQSARGVWSDIRHYIGRLGSWTKATQILILGARRFPQHIENAQVEVIGPFGPADLPSRKCEADLRSIVKRMFPVDQAALVEGLSQALVEVDSVAQIESRFRTDYANFKPRPHAELLVLEHFYHNNFSFIADDKYIGCSKPSCYCCHAYIQRHPGGFTPRPCHGNLWINWAPPIPLSVAAPRNDRQGPNERPQDHHTFKMLQAMVVVIRQDLEDQISSRRPKRERQPDSTTGMSSVIQEIHAPPTSFDYSSGESGRRIEISSASKFTPLENEDRTKTGLQNLDNSASVPHQENADRDNYDRLPFRGHRVTTQEQRGTYEDNAQENDDEREILTDAENWSEQCSRSRRTDSSEDDEDGGGVLIF